MAQNETRAAHQWRRGILPDRLGGPLDLGCIHEPAEPGRARASGLARRARHAGRLSVGLQRGRFRGEVVAARGRPLVQPGRVAVSPVEGRMDGGRLPRRRHQRAPRAAPRRPQPHLPRLPGGRGLQHPRSHCARDDRGGLLMLRWRALHRATGVRRWRSRSSRRAVRPLRRVRRSASSRSRPTSQRSSSRSGPATTIVGAVAYADHPEAAAEALPRDRQLPEDLGRGCAAARTDPRDRDGRRGDRPRRARRRSASAPRPRIRRPSRKCSRTSSGSGCSTGHEAECQGGRGRVCANGSKTLRARRLDPPPRVVLRDLARSADRGWWHELHLRCAAGDRRRATSSRSCESEGPRIGAEAVLRSAKPDALDRSRRSARRRRTPRGAGTRSSRAAGARRRGGSRPAASPRAPVCSTAWRPCATHSSSARAKTP